MTVSEIHINLGILLQKVNTHKSKNFLTQELDMLFNFVQANYKDRKIDGTSSPRQISLFDTQTSVDSLNNLFETETLYPINIKEGEVTVLLPFDFYGWISASANIAYDCKDNSTSISNGYICKESSLLNLKDINLTNLTDFIITLNYTDKTNTNKDVVLFDYTTLPNDYLPQDGVKDYLRSFIFINALVKIINDKFISINETVDNKFYVKYDNKANKLVINSTTVYTLDFNSNLELYSFIDTLTVSNKINLVNTITSPVAVDDLEYTPYIKTSHLSKSSARQLRINRTRETIKVIIPKSVIFASLTVNYIRKPRDIDYLLGINSDLPDDVVNKIIADTAQLIKGIIATDSYDKFARENILIE